MGRVDDQRGSTCAPNANPDLFLDLCRKVGQDDGYEARRDADSEMDSETYIMVS